MLKNALQIECQYTGKENIQQLILQSFQLYLSRILDSNHSGAVSCS